MYVVGIAQLAGELQNEVPLLAADLGMAPYDARMLLAPGIPEIVLLSAEKDRAMSLVSKLRERGHDALAFDTRGLVSNGQMVQPRQITISAEGLTSADRYAQHLNFADIFLLVRATHTTTTETSSETTKKSFSLGRAVMTGGLVMRKKTTQTDSAHSYDKIEVLYLYPSTASSPWLLAETGTRYLGLGDRLAPTERANFLKVVDLIRSRAEQARFDDRLVGRKTPTHLLQTTLQTMGDKDRLTTSTNASAVDLLCHLTAMWHFKEAR